MYIGKQCIDIILYLIHQMISDTDMKMLARALEFASKKHSAQRRKSGDIPYINHPIQVMNILVQAGITNYEVLCAAVLHDTVEDTDTSPEQLEKQFNHRIKDIVLQCSDDKSLSKSERKKMQIEHSLHVSSEAKLVKIADKLSNNGDIIKSPPAGWSEERVRGYQIWSYAVLKNLRGANEILDNRIDSWLETTGVNKLSQQQREKKLQEYLQLLK